MLRQICDVIALVNFMFFFLNLWGGGVAGGGGGGLGASNFCNFLFFFF